jgi:site-specific DNA recombinase
MRAAIYCRVSTEDQGENGTSLDSQLSACLNKAKELGHEVPEAYIFKETYSGLTIDRPKLTDLRKLAKDGRFGVIIVYSPDRLSREGETILNLVKEFKIQGLKLLFVNNQFDDTMNGKIVGFMLGWASELEAAQIKERTMRGKRTKALNGTIPIGCGKGIYGYDWNKINKERIINESEAGVVRYIFKLIGEGKSRHKVACILNGEGVPSKAGKSWHPLTINRIVTNPAYIGQTYYGMTRQVGKQREAVPKDDWVSLPDATPPIITQDTFDRAQQAIKDSNHINRGRPLHDYLLSGFMTCANCGSPVVGACLGNKYRYYRCRGAVPTSVRGIVCREKYIKADQIEKRVWSIVEDILANPMTLLESLKRADADTEELEFQREINTTRLVEFEEQQKRLVALFRLGTIDEALIKTEMDTIDADRREIRAELHRIEEVLGKTADYSCIEEKLEAYIDEVKLNTIGGSFQDKRMVLKALGIWVEATFAQVKVTARVSVNGIELEKVVEDVEREKVCVCC